MSVLASVVRRRRAGLPVAALVIAAVAAPPAAAQQGDTVRMLWEGDVDTLDPGATYLAAAQAVANATQRPLYSFHPGDASRAIPDLAAGAPAVSADGLTVTVRLKAGVRFSPPVSREVTSGDVKYAIERGFFASVGTPYAVPYFGSLAGARAGAPPGATIPGIETPDPRTVVFRLRLPQAGSLSAALVLGLTAPVPPEYAARFDARRRSTYGRHQVATGPYMIRSDAAGNVVGYRPGRRIELVRNPAWVRATDFRPAALDRIDIVEGHDDPRRVAREILRGRGLVSGDLAPPVAGLRRELRRDRDQFAFVDGGAVNYVPLNTALAPFDDPDVRRAVAAAMNRERLLRIIGGRLAGDVATHFIPPGTAGFERAGGRAGAGEDFLASPRGNRARAARYLRRAGYPGRYTGRRPLQVISAPNPVARVIVREVSRTLRSLGFRLQVRTLSLERGGEVCGRPRERVHVCPLAGWIQDFPNPQSILEPLFGGESITQEANTNWSQLDVERVNRAIETAKGLADPAARARAWAGIDRRVTHLAAAVPLAWPRTSAIRSADVRGVLSEAFQVWDLSFLSRR